MCSLLSYLYLNFFGWRIRVQNPIHYLQNIGDCMGIRYSSKMIPCSDGLPLLWLYNTFKKHTQKHYNSQDLHLLQLSLGDTEDLIPRYVGEFRNTTYPNLYIRLSEHVTQKKGEIIVNIRVRATHVLPNTVYGARKINVLILFDCTFSARLLGLWLGICERML